MKKFVILVLMISFGFSAVAKKGQKYYMKSCSKCHGEGGRGGNLSSIDGWTNYFKNDAKELIKIHIGEEGEKNVTGYLKSKEFKKEKKRMLRFLHEFANDSDSIPSCNN